MNQRPCQEFVKTAAAARVLSRLFMMATLCCIGIGAHGAEVGRGSTPPNIVFILVDDK